MDKVTFQLLCASDFDVGRQFKSRKSVVVLTGRQANGKRVILVCEGFLPSLRTRRDDGETVTDLLNGLAESEVGDELAFEFKGYHAEKTRFDRLSFRSNAAFSIARKRLKESGIEVYDAAMPSCMQMLASLGLSTCGWLTARGELVHGRAGDGALVVRAHWNDVSECDDPLMRPQTAPFTILSFDIECASSHGEFPCAKKRYEKVARELASLRESQLVSAINVRQILVDAYTGSRDADGNIGRIFAKAGKVPDAAALDAAASSISDCALDRGATEQERRAAAFSNLFAPRPGPARPTQDDGASSGEDEPGEARKCSAVRNTLYDRILAALRRANLPALQGDPIIQIGAVHAGIAEAQTDRGGADQHIFVLGECDEIDGVNVHTFGDERSLLVAFFQYVRRVSPDFFTGYNTHGFDIEYIEARADELNIDPVVNLDASLYTFDTIQDVMGIEDGDRMEANHRVFRKSGSVDREETSLDMLGRVAFDLMYVVQKGHSLPSYKLDAVAHHFTGERKDDVTPAQIFASHTGTASDRALVARYCVQDCALVLHLASKLNTVMNAMGMAGVCSVPVSWIFSRGQGCKILSLVSRQCMEDGFAIPSMSRSDARVEYEGATVLQPKVGAYIDDPIAVLDFASLYPSSMISSNISHDTLLALDAEGTDVADDPVLDARVGDTLEYDITQNCVCQVSGRVLRCERSGRVRARFVGASTRVGVLPRILERLLAERKRVRAQIKHEPDAFKKSTLDGLQLAYKITANSLYGQLGAPTSPVFLPDLAAATTAVGRRMLQHLKRFAESEFAADVIYGDTDSCFMRFPVTGTDVNDRIRQAVETATACSDAFRKEIPHPHNAEYEKILCPFVLLSKKRYTGGLYETADSTPRRVSMGIVLKRRDNAPIVKRIYGGVIDLVMQRDVEAAARFAKEQTMLLARGRVETEELIVSKTLRAPSAYVDPSKIAHVVLAKRMNDREPGSAPAVGERIPYVFVVARKGTLQGDRIEHPDYVVQLNKKIDYNHYLTNQIHKPLLQLLSVLLDKIPGARVSAATHDPKTVSREVDRLIFAEAMATAPAVQGGLQSISSFFKPKSS